MLVLGEPPPKKSSFKSSFDFWSSARKLVGVCNEPESYPTSTAIFLRFWSMLFYNCVVHSCTAASIFPYLPRIVIDICTLDLAFMAGSAVSSRIEVRVDTSRHLDTIVILLVLEVNSVIKCFLYVTPCMTGRIR